MSNKKIDFNSYLTGLYPELDDEKKEFEIAGIRPRLLEIGIVFSDYYRSFKIFHKIAASIFVVVLLAFSASLSDLFFESSFLHGDVNQNRGWLLFAVIFFFVVSSIRPTFQLDRMRTAGSALMAAWLFFLLTCVYGGLIFFVLPSFTLDPIASDAPSIAIVEPSISKEVISNGGFKYNGLILVVSGLYSGCLLLLGNWIAGMRDAGFNRRSATLDLMMQSRFSDTAQSLGLSLRKHFTQLKPIPGAYVYMAHLSAQEFKEKFPDDDNNGHDKLMCEIYESVQAAKWLLNYYEFVAIGIKNRDFDELLLRDSLEEMLEDAAKIACLIIHDQRVTRSNPAIYENLVALLLCWSNSNDNRDALAIIQKGQTETAAMISIFGEDWNENKELQEGPTA